MRTIRILVVAMLVVARGALAQASFPASWAGDWEGMLTTISGKDSVRNRIPVSLRIAPEPGGAAWTWRTVFNNDPVRGLRDYRLIVRDSARGFYATDERNGIVLEESFVDGTLFSVFQVGSQVLESRYTLRADTLVQDITFWSATPVATTRGQGANSERGAEVQSFRVTGRQRMVMTRRGEGATAR